MYLSSVSLPEQLTQIIITKINCLLKSCCIETFYTGCLEWSPCRLWSGGSSPLRHSVSTLRTANSHCLQLFLGNILLKVKSIEWKHGWYENKLLKIISVPLKKKPLIPSFRTLLILLAAATWIPYLGWHASALISSWFCSSKKTHFLRPVLWWPNIK